MTQTTTGLFPVTDPDRHAKGRQKMHGLALYTKRVWETSRSFETSLCKGPQPDAELIALDIAPALAAIRTLDLEVIRNGQSPADQQRYLDLQDTDAQGQVVRGLVLARNADVHLPAALDVHADIDLGDVKWRVVPQWQPYASLPHVIRTSTGTKPSSHAAYRHTVGGHRVIETLLDAFAFFLLCDPSLARRDSGTGKLAYFPLAGEMVVLGDYERRHPDHLNREEMAARTLQLAQDNPPTGTGREIRHSSTCDGSVLYCGRTGPGFFRDFTEPGMQIVRDIRAGYPYSVVYADGTPPSPPGRTSSCTWRANRLITTSFPARQGGGGQCRTTPQTATSCTGTNVKERKASAGCALSWTTEAGPPSWERPDRY
ncbi:hypothetical protein ACFY0A_40665 [Streptomyces sp. NPDC001698]|uniref:hypothetical protein n=1 Tax=Streptomyces sp. NPDC001698 TaxID=3364601 RepID=UPI00369EE851